jgi:hypothetical protein
MTRIARIWSRLFGALHVVVFAPGQDEAVFAEDYVAWCWHWRGVLRVTALFYGGKYDPAWHLYHYRFPLANVAYWTREREW